MEWLLKTGFTVYTFQILVVNNKGVDQMLFCAFDVSMQQKLVRFSQTKAHLLFKKFLRMYRPIRPATASMVCVPWVKVFRTIPEFRIFRLIFQRRGDYDRFSDLYSVYLKTIDLLNF